MKLEKLQSFSRHINNEFIDKGIVAVLYYYYNGAWRTMGSGESCSEADSRDLERAKKEQVSYHATNSVNAWYNLGKDNCAVKLEYEKSPRLHTRRRDRDRLNKIYDVASNEYKVTHNNLTHLLARDAFRSVLQQAVADVEASGSSRVEAQESLVPRIFAVMALDIDHFKQVNDTWGHIYGDQVLKTFGRRLEYCADAIMAEGVGCPVVFLGHPSGEEFLVLISANADRDQFTEWANRFRMAIADQVIPTDAEWQWLSTDGSVASIVPPPLHERATTTSVGVIISNGNVQRESIDETVSCLLDRADTALYRAKAAGRNQAILYDEILSSYGRVLEYNSGTKVVAIDIGASVGVTVGQEFKVYTPTFSGKTKFTINDGRTKRTIGVYPKVESARVVVFNTQADISFAYIAEPINAAPVIDAGSHLEAIPAGSIGHLLPSSKYLPYVYQSAEPSGADELAEVVKAHSAKDKPFAVVLRFIKDSECLRKYGSVALNAALAKLYRETQLTFGGAKAISVLDKASICVVGKNADYNDERIEGFVDSMSREFPELLLVAGVFCEDDRKASIKDGQTALDSANAVEFARFAASNGVRSGESGVRHFGYGVASAALQALREARSYKVAYADYERLRQLGVESAGIFNLGGLIASGLGLRRQAFEHYAEAIARDPDKTIFKSNYGMAAYRIGEVDSALRVLNGVSMDEIELLKENHLVGYINYGRLLASAKMSGSSSYNSERFERIAPEILKMSEAATMPDMNILRMQYEGS